MSVEDILSQLRIQLNKIVENTRVLGTTNDNGIAQLLAPLTNDLMEICDRSNNHILTQIEKHKSDINTLSTQIKQLESFIESLNIDCTQTIPTQIQFPPSPDKSLLDQIRAYTYRYQALKASVEPYLAKYKDMYNNILIMYHTLGESPPPQFVKFVESPEFLNEINLCYHELVEKLERNRGVAHDLAKQLCFLKEHLNDQLDASHFQFLSHSAPMKAMDVDTLSKMVLNPKVPIDELYQYVYRLPPSDFDMDVLSNSNDLPLRMLFLQELGERVDTYKSLIKERRSICAPLVNAIEILNGHDDEDDEDNDDKLKNMPKADSSFCNDIVQRYKLSLTTIFTLRETYLQLVQTKQARLRKLIDKQKLILRKYNSIFENDREISGLLDSTEVTPEVLNGLQNLLALYKTRLTNYEEVRQLLEERFNIVQNYIEETQFSKTKDANKIDLRRYLHCANTLDKYIRMYRKNRSALMDVVTTYQQSYPEMKFDDVRILRALRAEAEADTAKSTLTHTFDEADILRKFEEIYTLEDNLNAPKQQPPEPEPTIPAVPKHNPKTTTKIQSSHMSRSTTPGSTNTNRTSTYQPQSRSGSATSNTRTPMTYKHGSMTSRTYPNGSTTPRNQPHVM